MKTWKQGLLATAMTLAMAATAGAQTTATPTTPSGATTPPGTTMRSDIPRECVNLTGRATSDCVRDHNPSSIRSKSGMTSDTNTGMHNGAGNGNDATTGTMRKDKAGGGGAAGTGSSAGAAGSTGSAGSGASGAAGAAGGNGGATGGGNGGGTGGGNGK